MPLANVFSFSNINKSISNAQRQHKEKLPLLLFDKLFNCYSINNWATPSLIIFYKSLVDFMSCMCSNEQDYYDLHCKS